LRLYVPRVMPIANRAEAESCFKQGYKNPDKPVSSKMGKPTEKRFSILVHEFGFSEKRVGSGAHMVRAVHRPPQLVSGNTGTPVPASRTVAATRARHINSSANVLGDLCELYQALRPVNCLGQAWLPVFKWAFPTCKGARWNGPYRDLRDSWPILWCN
jgi:hypothetical protein